MRVDEMRDVSQMIAKYRQTLTREIDELKAQLHNQVGIRTSPDSGNIIVGNTVVLNTDEERARVWDEAIEAAAYYHEAEALELRGTNKT